jgi:antitoxin MazE
MASLKVKIIQIGNSRGIRLSKALIEQYKLKDEVILETKKDCILISPIENPRANWDMAFKKMFREGDDTLLDKDFEVETEWNREEWEW